MAINVVALEGRLTRPPEIRKTESGVSVMQFSIAVPRRFKKENQPEADFINCVAWKQAADFLGSYAHQGDMISLQGRMQSRSYEKDGKRVFIQEVICEAVSIVAYKKQDQPKQETKKEDPMADADPAMFGAEDLSLDDISSDDLPFY